MMWGLIIFTFNLTISLVVFLMNYYTPHRSPKDRMIGIFVSVVMLEMILQLGMAAEKPGKSVEFLVFGLVYAPILYLTGRSGKEVLSVRKIALHSIPFLIFVVLFLIWMFFATGEEDFRQIYPIVNAAVLLSFIAYYAAGRIFVRRGGNEVRSISLRYLFMFWGMGLIVLGAGWVAGIIFEFPLVNADLFLKGWNILLAGLLIHLYRFYFLKFNHQHVLSERKYFIFKSLILDQFAKDSPQFSASPLGEEDEEAADISSKIDFLDPGIDLPTLASQMEISVSTVEKRIKDETGTSFKNFVNMKRVEHACDLLEKKPDLPMRELMLKSGFKSPATFYRNFKKHTGMSPKEFGAQFSDTIR